VHASPLDAGSIPERSHNGRRISPETESTVVVPSGLPAEKPAIMSVRLERVVSVKYCVDVPNFGTWSDPKRFAEFAHEVEAAGWDGISVWDHILFWDGVEVADPWVMLAAAAMATERIRLMTMVTPVPRRHPWKLSRECVSLDLLSDGRLTLGVGIGWPTDPEFTRFGGETDLRTRADMLDEGLQILTGLWTGEPFGFTGDHYRLEEVTFLPRPIQRPRIPIWVAAMWPKRRPVRRAAVWDGIAPITYDFDKNEFLPPTTDTVAAIAGYAREHRTTDEPFDIALSGTHRPGEDVSAWHRELEAAGATWWRDGWIPDSGIDPEQWYRDVLEGPPSRG
jgi:alkanesulfonate monooxygenase SsuD/methylene tetrahydromethanopterin reductase-like flavin-dependent oxidoreductase (luciferase family)